MADQNGGTQQVKLQSSSIKELRRTHWRRTIAYLFGNAVKSCSWLFYIAGLVWLMMLPRDTLHHEARVDENALLPGQTTKYFSALDIWVASQYEDQIRKLAKGQADDHASNAAFVRAQLQSFGVDSDIQHFTLAMSDGDLQGSNAYGVFRAPRGDGTEAIVLSAPWFCHDGSVNARGVSYVLTFAKFITKFSHWSKDFIFLITNPSPIGTQAWLEAYHGANPTAMMEYDMIERRGGVIQEAINLEFCGAEDYTAIGISVDGLNGQLPNADLITTLARCSQWEGLPVALHDTVSPRSFRNNWTSYLHKAENIVDYMEIQALGTSHSNHFLYSKYHIEAASIKGLSAVEGTSYKISGEQIGRALESTLRSLNNLLERLHHAYWFYLMPTATSYIPISVYIPPIILLSVTLVLESLATWWTSGDALQQRPSRPARISGTHYAARPLTYSEFNIRSRPLFLPVVTLVLCHGAGALALYMAPSLQLMAQNENVNPMSVVAGIIVVTAVTYAFMIPTLQRMMEGSGASTHATAPAWIVLKSFACAELGAALIALSTLNPSLSVCLALLSVPAFVLARPTGSHFRFFLELALLSLASPIGLVGIITAFYGFSAVHNAVNEVIQGWMLFGGWILPFICLVYWPLNMVGHIIIGMSL